MMTSYRLFTLCFSFAAFALTAVSPINASEDFDTREVEIRENDKNGIPTNYLVRIELRDPQTNKLLPTETEYENDEPCGNASHRTRYGTPPSPQTGPGRYFCHSHVHFDLPATGIDQQGKERTVTAANIKAYWDVYYYGGPGGLMAFGGENTKVNCFGYALGYDTWILDPSFLVIFLNDYNMSTVSAIEEGDVIEQSGIHAIVVTVAVEREGYGVKLVSETKEKNFESGVYGRKYLMLYTPAGTYWKKKP